jgi:hypothetical protein
MCVWGCHLFAVNIFDYQNLDVSEKKKNEVWCLLFCLLIFLVFFLSNACFSISEEIR